MGGKALKTINTVRMDAADYFQLESDVFARLKKYNLKVSTIPAYADKESFGDMDVLIEYSKDVDYLDIVKSFNPTEVFKNGKVISFDYKNFQIDLIVTDPSFFEFSKTYYSFNDLGNLMGRVAHKLGLKYGHEGLYYTLRENNDHIISKILVSTNIADVFNLLDYDYSRFQKGFDNLDDIFKYVTSSKYFNPSIFLLANRNYKARTRDRKRPTYRAFLKYSNTLSGDFYEFSNKESYLPMIIDRFPNLRESIKNETDAFNKKKRLNAKFNGLMIMKTLNIFDKDLGSFIAKHNNDPFKSWVLASPTRFSQNYLDTIARFREMKKTNIN